MSRCITLPTDTTVLVVSDTHILLPTARRAELEAFITAQNPQTLVFAGDTLDIFYAETARNKASVQVAEAAAFLTFLQNWLAAGASRHIVVLAGNHDRHWDTARWALLLSQLAPLVAPRQALAPYESNGRLTFATTARLASTLITHGHHGFWAEWIWHFVEPIRRVWGKAEPKLLTLEFVRLRHRIVAGSGFYGRLALGARLRGATRVIHGHVHNPLTLRRWGVELMGLPSWREDEAHARGGGLWYTPASQSWQRVSL